MGLSLTYRLYKGIKPEAFRAGFEEAARSLGGSITWDVSGEGDRMLRTADAGDVHTVYIPYQGTDHAFCVEAGRHLNIPWMALRIQEDSIWDYTLFRGAEIIDTFSVCPQYWEGGTAPADYYEQWRGRPDVLASAWGIPVEAVSGYLVNWGYRADEDAGFFEFEKNGKAYPDDRHEYGDCHQFNDVLRLLGGRDPADGHTIVLPSRHLGNTRPA